MKVYISKILQLREDYQEPVIGNDFLHVEYKQIPLKEVNIQGILEDVYTLEPKCWYEIILQDHISDNFDTFKPNRDLLKSGISVSNIDKENRSIFIHNTTLNCIYIKENAFMGEVL